MTLTQIKEAYLAGGDPVKLFREQQRYTHFCAFLSWLEE